jgi:hypothetical protein
MKYNEALDKNGKHLDWDLVINKKPYQVIRYDGYNKEDYVCFEIKPHYQRVNDYYIPDENVELILCNGVRTNSPSWEIKQSKEIRLKNKWNETSTRFLCVTTVYRNGIPFFEIGGDEDYSYHKAKSILIENLEGPINFCSRWWKESLLNRIIRYDNQPAIIKRVYTNPFSMWVEPIDGVFSLPSHWDVVDTDEWNDEYAKGLSIQSVLDSKINWYPKD